MQVRTRVFAALVFLGSLIAIPATAEPASAATCSGQFCAWLDIWFTGERWAWQSGNDEADWAISHASNKTSSWMNQAAFPVWVYDTHGFKDPLFCLQPNHQIPRNPDFSDKPNAHHFVTSCVR